MYFQQSVLFALVLYGFELTSIYLIDLSFLIVCIMDRELCVKILLDFVLVQKILIMETKEFFL